MRNGCPRAAVGGIHPILPRHDKGTAGRMTTGRERDGGFNMDKIEEQLQRKRTSPEEGDGW